MGFEDLFREARERDEYWIEDAVLSFTTQLYGLVKQRGLSQANLAERLGVSQPYIARVLKGKDNLTLATMVKLARAVGGRFEISLRDGEEPPPSARSGVPRKNRKKKPAPAG